MKIYTRVGDDGSTSLFSGGRVPKHHLRVESYGIVDELNSWLGYARSQSPSAVTDEYLVRIQHQLFNLGADLATPMDAKTTHIVRMDAPTVEWLETSIDRLSEDIEPLRYFILPGGGTVGAQLQIARTLCRRAERVTSLLAENEPVGPFVLPYLNRLSDFLFTLARWENKQAGISEDAWRVQS